MCGIAGIIEPGIREEPAPDTARRADELLVMLERIRYRGDAERFAEHRSEAGVAMGTNRLAIVDRPNGQQPLVSEDGNVWLAYNGELYGFLPLRQELEGRGHRFDTGSDTEVVLRAYLEWGKGCVERLDGMFAFVVYDRRDGTVLAARDHIGIKPLYYTCRDGVYSFASEQKCLVTAGGEIQTVLPGTYLKDGSTVRYFRLGGAAPELSEGEVVRRYRELFDAAVRKQVQTDLPVAVMFSGGIDSAAVLAAARRFHPNVTAFTVGIEGAADIDVARRYCRENGIPHVVTYFTREDLISVLPEVVYASEFFESIDVMDACVAYFAYRSARQSGFKVALCGEGSDEVLAGYDLFKDHDDPYALMAYRVQNLHRTDLQRVDRSSMMNSVETRVPFLDRDLLQFSYSVPMHLKLRDGSEKWVLREAFRDTLPDYIVDRPKIRMPDGSGLKYTLVEYARQPVDLDADLVSELNIDSMEGRFFLRRYLDAGFPRPRERFKRAGYDYSPNGYFEFIS